MEKVPLTEAQWGEIYNVKHLESCVSAIENKQFSYQTIEMEKLTGLGESILEIGSGSGSTSVFLALRGRKTTALDFSNECLALTEALNQHFGTEVKTVYADAMKPLPFAKNQFDIVFHAGLLEHFEKAQRVKLLRNWGECGKKQISIIPNAASLAYRVGKSLMEKNGTWEYGLELPQYSLAEEFNQAGFKVIEEYTIGAEHSLEFLPNKHYLKKALKKWLKDNPSEDNCGQGYLLVTIAEKRIE